MIPPNTGGRGSGSGSGGDGRQLGGRGGGGGGGYRGRGGGYNRGGGGFSGRYNSNNNNSNDNYNDRGGRSFSDINSSSYSSNNDHIATSGGGSAQQYHHQQSSSSSSYHRPQQQQHYTSTATTTTTTTTSNNSVISSYSELALADPSQLLASSLSSSTSLLREPPVATSSLLTSTTTTNSVTDTNGNNNNSNSTDTTTDNESTITTDTATTANNDNNKNSNSTYASMNINYEKNHQKASYRSAERSFLTSSQQERRRLLLEQEQQQQQQPWNHKKSVVSTTTPSMTSTSSAAADQHHQYRDGGGRAPTTTTGGGGGGGGRFPMSSIGRGDGGSNSSNGSFSFHRTMSSDNGGAVAIGSGRGFRGGGGPGRIGGNVGRGGNRDAAMTKLDVPLQNIRGRPEIPFRTSGSIRPTDEYMYFRPDDKQHFSGTTQPTAKHMNVTNTATIQVVSKIPDPPKRIRNADSGSEGEILSDAEMTPPPSPVQAPITTTIQEGFVRSTAAGNQYNRANERTSSAFETMESNNSVPRPSLYESFDMPQQSNASLTKMKSDTQLYQEYDMLATNVSHRLPTATTTTDHSYTQFKYSQSEYGDGMSKSVPLTMSSTEWQPSQPNSKVPLPERRLSHFTQDDYSYMEREQDQQMPVREYEKYKQRSVDATDAYASSRSYNSRNDPSRQNRGEYHGRSIPETYSQRNETAFEIDKLRQSFGSNEQHSIRDSLEHLRNSPLPLTGNDNPSQQQRRLLLSHERVDHTTKSLPSTSYDDLTAKIPFSSNTADFGSAATYPSHQELVNQQYSYRSDDRMSLSTAVSPVQVNRNDEIDTLIGRNQRSGYGDRPLTSGGYIPSDNGGRGRGGRGRGDFSTYDRRNSVGGRSITDGEYSAMRRQEETVQFSSISDRGSIRRRDDDDNIDSLMDRYSDGHSVRSSFGRGRGNIDMDGDSASSAGRGRGGRGRGGGRSESMFGRGRGRDTNHSWSGGEVGRGIIDRQTPPPPPSSSLLRITDPHPLRPRGGPSPVSNEYEHRYSDSRPGYNSVAHSISSTKSPRELYGNPSYKRSWERTATPNKRDFDTSNNVESSQQHQHPHQRRSTSTPTQEEWQQPRRIDDSSMMVADELDTENIVKIEDDEVEGEKNMIRSPTPPPLVVPPIASEPSGLVLALLRLADLEALMEYEHVKFQQLAFRQQLIRAEYTALEAMPIGMASYQSEYDQYIASLEQQNQP